MSDLQCSFSSLEEGEVMIYKVHDITGEFATDAESGQALHDLIVNDLEAGKSVELDFSGVNVFATMFFNFAIGQLLLSLPMSVINHLLTYQNLNPDGKDLVKRSIENAQEYYADPDYRRIVDDVIGEYAASLSA